MLQLGTGKLPLPSRTRQIAIRDAHYRPPWRGACLPLSRPSPVTEHYVRLRHRSSPAPASAAAGAPARPHAGRKELPPPARVAGEELAPGRSRSPSAASP